MPHLNQCCLCLKSVFEADYKKILQIISLDIDELKS